MLMLALAALIALLGSGCTGAQADTTTVRFWAIGREGEVISTLLPEFEKAHPGIRVDMQQIPLTAAHEKLLTAFAADTLPDLCQLGNTWIAEFAALDALTPLEPYVQGSEVVKQDDYFPGIWETNVIDGQLVGIPGMSTRACCSIARTSCARPGSSCPSTPGNSGTRPWPRSRRTWARTAMRS